jgi:steroid delta-isomerase-like uncharacterized protein
MSQSTPLAIVLRWFEEVWNQRRESTIDELIGPDSVCHADEGPIRGPEEFKQRQFRPFIAAFPDLHLTVDEAIADDPDVVVRWSATGTHRGPELGFEKTDRPVNFRGISWIRVENGQFAEGWQSTNIPEVLRSLAGA